MVKNWYLYRYLEKEDKETEDSVCISLNYLGFMFRLGISMQDNKNTSRRIISILFLYTNILFRLGKKDKVEEANGGRTGIVSWGWKLFRAAKDVPFAVFLPSKPGVESGPWSSALLIQGTFGAPAGAAASSRSPDFSARSPGRQRAAASAPPLRCVTQTDTTTMNGTIQTRCNTWQLWTPPSKKLFYWWQNIRENLWSHRNKLTHKKWLETFFNFI